MKMTGWVLLGTLLWASHAYSEGAWHVDGHSFTNVHAWQQGGDVRVSGRVSGGKAKSPLRSWIYVRGDDGRTYKAQVRIERFTGQGETFETRVKVSDASKWWRIERIEIPEIEFSKPGRIDHSMKGPIQQHSGPQSQQSETSLKIIPFKSDSANDMPTVRFISTIPACMTIRELDSGRLMLMKNIAPDDRCETRLPVGKYTAHIVGKGFDFTKQITVTSGTDRFEFNLPVNVTD